MNTVTHLNDNGVALRGRTAESAAVRWDTSGVVCSSCQDARNGK